MTTQPLNLSTSQLINNSTISNDTAFFQPEKLIPAHSKEAAVDLLIVFAELGGGCPQAAGAQ